MTAPTDELDAAFNDAKRLLSTMNFIVNETMNGEDRYQEMLFGLIDALDAKIDIAKLMVEARQKAP